MLVGRGYEKVYNLSGGIKAWQNVTVFGDEFSGLEIFTGKESLAELLTVAYSLEQGLREFYLQMSEKVSDVTIRKSFIFLADIEIKHQKSILSFYQQLTGLSLTQDEFEKTNVLAVSEGGLTTEQYIELFGQSPYSLQDIAAVAISIEAQALDLYLRAADTSSGQAKDFLVKIANEEQTHLNMLAQMVEES